ncbi:MAG: TonB-dependent receptor [Candidatus Marinimicrobia bacterium]|nr:TonB-dependent receptor [Candidatus Neomarinimicrobiota bacterium]
MYKLFLLFILIIKLVSAEIFVGKVVDSLTGMPIVEANIKLKASVNEGTVTDPNGIFYFSQDKDSALIEIDAIGYRKIEKKVLLSQSNTMIIKLEQSAVKLSPINVLADRSRISGIGQNFYRIPGSLSIISKAEVLEFHDTDINRVVSQVPGVYIQEEDGYGLRPNIGMRGSGLERSSKINMMEDGVLIAPAPYSSPAAYYSPTAGRMESFEIRKGSSQVKYGPHSTGGAINYISATIPKDLDFNGLLSLGEYGSQVARFKSGMSSKNYGLMIQTHNEKSEGFKELQGEGNTGYDKSDFLFKARINTNSDLALLELKLSSTDEISNETYLGLTRDDFEENPYMRYRASQKDKMDADHQQVSLTAIFKPFDNLDITSTLYNNDFHRNWYKLNKVNGHGIASILSSNNSSDSTYQLLSVNNSIDDIYDIKANNRIYKSRGIQTILRSNFKFIGKQNDLMVGFRVHSDEMNRFQKSDKYKMYDGNLIMTTEGIWGEGSKNNRLYLASANSMFIENELTWSKAIITIGSRMESIHLERKDWGSDLNRDSTASSINKDKLNIIIPGIGLSYQLFDGAQIFTGIHRGFSPPGPGFDDEDKVLPEESNNFELGLRFNQGFHNAELVTFYNDYKNLLGEDTEAAGSGTYAQFNGGKVLINGLEFSYSNMFKINKLFLPFSFSNTYTIAKFKNNFDSDFSPWGNVSMNDELPYIPRNMLHARIGIEMGNIQSYIRFKHIDKTRTVAGKDKLSETNSTDAINSIDLVSKYSINKNIIFEIKFYNITNSKSSVANRPAGLRPNMPRQIITSISFDF